MPTIGVNSEALKVALPRHRFGLEYGMAAQPQPRLTAAEYLERERAAEFRHEYYNGQMYAMSGGSLPHALIIANFAGELRAGLKKTPCRVMNSDLRVSVSPNGLYTYPDIVVVCASPQYFEGQPDTLTNPVLLVEVLSPSTELMDRGLKALQYRSIASLQEYALVSQTDPRVEIFRRGKSEWTLLDVAGLESQVELASVNCRVPMAEIYDKVDFEAP